MTSHAPTPAALLREPANQVSPRAVQMWRVTAVAELVAVAAVLLLVAVLVPARPWWMWLSYAVVLLPLAAIAVWMPSVRNRIHRWEVTPGAVHTRSGWLTTKQRIAPLSRVQTVDTRRSALMRIFGLSAITVTTASSAGAITIEGLDRELAVRVVAELTEITAASEGDAT